MRICDCYYYSPHLLTAPSREKLVVVVVKVLTPKFTHFNFIAPFFSSPNCQSFDLSLLTDIHSISLSFTFVS